MGRKLKDRILMNILGIAFFLNLITINRFPPTIKELVVIGYMLLGFGALLFAWSVLTLRREGTSNVVDNGIYGIVRHPMYLGGMLMFCSHVFFCQNWIVVISTAIAIVCCYLLIHLADQRNIEKFGGSYKRYMQKVPRMNLLLGIIQMKQHGKKSKTNREIKK